MPATQNKMRAYLASAVRKRPSNPNRSISKIHDLDFRVIAVRALESPSIHTRPMRFDPSNQHGVAQVGHAGCDRVLAEAVG
jgi:hypothetical protein